MGRHLWMTHTHVSKGCGSLAGYPNANTGLLSQSTFRGVGMVLPEGFRQPFEKLRLSPQAGHIPGFARSHESERIAHLMGLRHSGR